MQFRTELKPKKSNIRITYDHRILSLGSCFAEHIGGLLDNFKFNIQLNPFGIIYNPAAITHSLDLLWENKKFEPDDLIEKNGIWSSLDHHSRFSGIDRENVVEVINRQIEVGHKRLTNLDLLILTFGTAHVFYHKAQERIVNNCHKLPASDFKRRLLTVNEVANQISCQLKRLKEANPALKVILTVSPVRHIRDGLVESKRSKSILLVAVHELADAFDYVQYYPSYEILLDDLRDYRFYNADMVHPSKEAVDYIWDHFSKTYFDKREEELIRQLGKLSAAMAHRPFFAGSEQHLSFMKDHLAKARNLGAKYPFLNLEEEIRYFSS